jgi:hypothetical protein
MKKVPAKKKKSKEPQPAKRNNPDGKPESSVDYGGLPARDLKKNLGCG